MKYCCITFDKNNKDLQKTKFKNFNSNQKGKKQYTGVISFNGTAQNFPSSDANLC